MPYDAPEKIEVRRKVISVAVTALTTDRATSVVVSPSSFNERFGRALAELPKLGERVDVAQSDVFRDRWCDLWTSRVGRKNPSDIHVLFLAGDDPTADLRCFEEFGVPLENIWAIESDKSTLNRAVERLKEKGLRLKLHHGRLQSFFSVVPQQFDIVYFDAMAPLFGGKPSTAAVLNELFLNQRLSPLSVLITNFAEVGKDILTQQNAAKRIGAHAWASRCLERPLSVRDFTETQVCPNLDKWYSEFISKFISQFCGQLIPWWRTCALPGARREFFSSELQNGSSEFSAKLGSIISPTLFGEPLLQAWRFALAITQAVDKSDPLQQFFSASIDRVSLHDVMQIAPLVRVFYNAKFGSIFGTTDAITNAISEDFRRVLTEFSWFDSGSNLFCDRPLSNLIVDLLFGLYGFPYHLNAPALKRFAYKGRATTMFTDVFVLDQARYCYDLLPTLHLFESGFPVLKQLLLRVCVDIIREKASYGADDLFYGGRLFSGSRMMPAARESIGTDLRFSEPDAEGDEVQLSPDPEMQSIAEEVLKLSRPLP